MVVQTQLYLRYYSTESNTDDGSCIYPGCTDSTATNYDANANLDDGSCVYASVLNVTTTVCTSRFSFCNDDRSMVELGS